ncbi:hypothetical protein OS128_05255 [Corynebacterium sp. P5848]|uniref:hypothetical protein n=1 Tax=Corynebacterium marambiense TaxID=2765364 RepID=UPI002260F85F|nr:hypothetical protein [Corynebacterium marambiense]MCX7542318.1 hypothetical protein [Corynebacterium marambiense]
MTNRLEMPSGRRLGLWVTDQYGEIGYITGFDGSAVHVVFPELGHVVEVCDLAELTLVDRPRVDLPGAGEPTGHWEYEAVTLSPLDGSAIHGWKCGENRDQCTQIARYTPHTIMRRRWISDWEQVEP